MSGRVLVYGRGGYVPPSNDQIIAGKDSQFYSKAGTAPIYLYRNLTIPDGPTKIPNTLPNTDYNTGNGTSNIFSPIEPSPNMSVAQLNEIIRQNGTAWNNGDQRTKALAHQYAEEARGYGGTKGVPIIFVHGLLSDASTFGDMIDKMQNDGYGRRSTTITIDQNGTLLNSTLNTRNNLIPVTFQNNEASISDQSKWLTEAINLIEKQYGTNHIDLVTHSMGGLAATKYIEDSSKRDVVKLVTLGSPIKGSELDSVMLPDVMGLKKILPAIKDLEYNSPAIQELYSNRDKFDQNVKVLSIAGKMSYIGGVVGDGPVTVNSAYGLRDYTTNIETPSPFNDFHTNIQKDNSVINYVEGFLFQRNNLK